MEDLEGKLVELIEKFENLAAEIAPEALELALLTARVAAAQAALVGLIWIGVGGVGVWLGTRMARKGVAIFSDDSVDDDAGAALVAASLFVGGGGAVAAVAGAFSALNVWPWVGIFYPEVWIAKQVLGW